jgi:phage-related tail protein
MLSDPAVGTSLTAAVLGLVSLGTQALTWAQRRAAKADAEAEAEAEAKAKAKADDLRAKAAADARASVEALVEAQATKLGDQLGALQRTVESLTADSRRASEQLTLIQARGIRVDGLLETLRRDVDAQERRAEGTRGTLETLRSQVTGTLAGLQAEVRHLGQNNGGS